MYEYHNPGCYHSALNYLSEITGISKKKQLILNDISETRNEKGKAKYSAYCIFIEKDGIIYYWPKTRTIKGGSKVFVLNIYNSPESVEFPIDTKFDKVWVELYRELSEFNIPIKNVGKYKDSLSGGWYQMVEMIEINGNYFAFMDCTCQ